MIEELKSSRLRSAFLTCIPVCVSESIVAEGQADFDYIRGFVDLHVFPLGKYEKV